MKYRLLATDLDGTVLDGLNLNKAVADAIGQLKNKQVKIVVATGRPLCTALPVARTLGLAEGYIVTFNGAEVYFNERFALQRYAVPQKIGIYSTSRQKTQCVTGGVGKRNALRRTT